MSYFNDKENEDLPQTIMSPCGKYRINMFSEVNKDIKEVEYVLITVDHNQEIYRFKVKNNLLFFCVSFFTDLLNQTWFQHNRFFINLNTRKFYDHNYIDYYSQRDFLWISVHNSPDGKTLAVKGCQHEDELRFYDFSDPQQGPLEIKIKSKAKLEFLKDKDDNTYLDIWTLNKTGFMDWDGPPHSVKNAYKSEWIKSDTDKNYSYKITTYRLFSQEYNRFLDELKKPQDLNEAGIIITPYVPLIIPCSNKEWWEEYEEVEEKILEEAEIREDKVFELKRNPDPNNDIIMEITELKN